MLLNHPAEELAQTAQDALETLHRREVAERAMLNAGIHGNVAEYERLEAILKSGMI